MKKFFKVIGICFLILVFLAGLVFITTVFDFAIDKKIDRTTKAVVQDVSQSPLTSITIPTNFGYNVSTFCIELTATPDEFVDYFENVLAKDTINQIIISGQRMGNDTRKIKWAIVYNNYKPIKSY